MPIYEFKCTECGKEFEEFRSITDDTVPACRFCKGKVKKLISHSSFQLKGSGWYVTDYGGKKPSMGEEKHDEASSDSPTSKEGETGKSEAVSSTESKEG
ncbi:MAG: zinc ribbon domain-containing protein [Syntrophobacterales bacterium]|nr:zinc ribbon domain-containing protein [Syntrophobacterales bacterium]OPX37646.1 MAG: hypothetical protein B1H13_12470 [Desulfobacteraceae bacterium 4484_190.3]